MKKPEMKLIAKADAARPEGGHSLALPDPTSRDDYFARLFRNLS